MMTENLRKLYKINIFIQKKKKNNLEQTHALEKVYLEQTYSPKHVYLDQASAPKAF